VRKIRRQNIRVCKRRGATGASASRYHYDLDANQELLADGIVNLGAGLFQGFAVGGSLSRSTANDAAGARSQVSSLVASALVLLTAIALTPLFHNLPQATLGAIVIRAVIGLMNVGNCSVSIACAKPPLYRR